MKLKLGFRLTSILLAVSLWLVVGLGVQAQTNCDSVAGNLLTNCGFEEGFRTVAGTNPRSVATGWQPWNAERTADMPTFQNTQPTYFASSSANAQGAIPRIREGGADSQVYFSFFETHDAGIYQQVSGITPGTELRFSIYGYVYSSSLDDLNVSENPGGVTLRVGIDPTGGTDPLASSVVYSDAAIFYDSFRQYSIIETAESDTVTVFVRTTVSEPVQFTYVYLDDAVLEVTPESEQPGETDEPTQVPTAIPTTAIPPTAVPTQVPTEDTSGQPTEEPSPTQEGQDSTEDPVVPTATPISGNTATPRPSTTTPVPPISDTFPGRIIHTVQRGDTVGNLATLYGSTLEAIKDANGLDDTYLIYRGQGLIIPVRIVPAPSTPVVVVVTATPGTTTGGGSTPGGNIYIIQRGDNLLNIARRFNTTIETLAQLNGIANPNQIFAGQQLRLPSGSGTGGTDGTAVPTSPPVATNVPTHVQPQPTSGIIPTAVPPAPRTHVVLPGDNLYRIAIRYNVSLAALGAANNITNFNLIFTGQVLQIP
jgi:LysM repeat protein